MPFSVSLSLSFSPFRLRWWIYGVAAAAANAFDIFHANGWVSGLMLMYARVRMPINKANCIFVLLNILLVRGIRIFLLLCIAFFRFLQLKLRLWSVYELVDSTYNFHRQIQNNIYFALASTWINICVSRAVSRRSLGILIGAFGARNQWRP